MVFWKEPVAAPVFEKPYFEKSVDETSVFGKPVFEKPVSKPAMQSAPVVTPPVSAIPLSKEESNRVMNETMLGKNIQPEKQKLPDSWGKKLSAVTRC